MHPALSDGRVCVFYARRCEMRRMHRKLHKKARRQQRRQLSFLEALRLYEGMPLGARWMPF